METLAVCTPQFKRLLPKNKYYEFELLGQRISFGLVESEKPKNWLSMNTNDSVLVEKKAFSCGFRDRSLLLTFREECLTHNTKHYYLPFGSEFVGEIVYVGKNVKRFKVGDRVIPNGSYPAETDANQGGLPTNFASQRFQTFNESQLVSVPDTISDEVAASITISGHTVFAMIRKLQLLKGSKVLVTAATSNTSLFAIKVLVENGYDIYALSTNKHFLDNTAGWNIKRIYAPDRVAEIVKNIARSIGGFDAVIDPFFDIYFPKVFDSLKQGGKYITCGLYNQHAAFNFQDNNKMRINGILLKSMVNNISIIGNCLGSLHDLENALAEISSGKYPIVIDSVYGPNEMEKFIERTFMQSERFGKVIYKY